MKRYHHQKGFSLVEALTGIVIIAVISTASWMGVSVMTRSGDVAHHQGMAVNLMQKSQEELRQLASNDFDRMDRCQFPKTGAEEPELTCGADISSEFPGFTRSVKFFSEEGSTELKRAVVKVEWNDWDGKLRQLESVILLARPPYPLPGNIAGQVIDADTNVPINDKAVTITATFAGAGGGFYSALSEAVVTNGQNYSVSERDSGYRLKPGDWNLTAKHNAYQDYFHPSPVRVNVNEETVVDIKMKKKPLGKKLTVKLLDTSTGNAAVFKNASYNKSYIQLYDDGQIYQFGGVKEEQAGGIELVRDFSADEIGSGLSLTVATEKAYQSGLAGGFDCNDENTPPSQYADGWSSGIIDKDGNVVDCDNRKGGVGTDRIVITQDGVTGARIEITPQGVENHVVDVPLVPVKKATLKGTVRDENKKTISGAKIYVRWPDDNNNNMGDNPLWDPYPAGTTDNNGEYSVTIPAAQELFANDSDPAHYLRVVATADLSGSYNCCDTASTVYSDKGWESLGAVYADATLTKDFTIKHVDYYCGDAQGNATNDKDDTPLNGVSVVISQKATTDLQGNYYHKCVDQDPKLYRIKVGNYNLSATLANFYTYSTAGNNWYAASGSLEIKKGETAERDFKLWPVKKEKIIVTVKDRASGQLLSNINVLLTPYYDKGTSQKTPVTGQVTFLNVWETWPPQSLPNDAYYNQTVKNHVLEVSDPAKKYNSVSKMIEAFYALEVLNITIELDKVGGGM